MTQPTSGDALFVVSYNPTTPNSWPESPFLTREPFAAVDGLVPGKKYTFHVKAVLDNAESKKKSVSTVLPVPEQPTNVVIDEVTSTSMHISWESPHDDAHYIVNIMDTAGALPDFPLTVANKEVTIDNLKEGETYKVTVATTVDGYTTDKHATQIETYADTQDTMLFPLDMDETTDEAQEKVEKSRKPLLDFFFVKRMQKISTDIIMIILALLGAVGLASQHFF